MQHWVLQVAALELQLDAESLAIAGSTSQVLDLESDAVAEDADQASNLAAHKGVLEVEHAMQTERFCEAFSARLRRQIKDHGAGASALLEKMLSARQALEAATTELCRIDTAIKALDCEAPYMANKHRLLRDQEHAKTKLGAARHALRQAQAEATGAEAVLQEGGTCHTWLQTSAQTLQVGKAISSGDAFYKACGTDEKTLQVEVTTLQDALSKLEDELQSCCEAYKFDSGKLELSSELSMLDGVLARISVSKAHELAFMEELHVDAEQACHRAKMLQHCLSRAAVQARQAREENTLERSPGLQQNFEWVRGEHEYYQDRHTALQSQLGDAEARLEHLSKRSGQLQSQRTLLKEHKEVHQQVCK
jgi:chromosome segregation ATPase